MWRRTSCGCGDTLNTEPLVVGALAEPLPGASEDSGTDWARSSLEQMRVREMLRSMEANRTRQDERRCLLEGGPH